MKHTVMVIEDEEALALILKYNLEKEGYNVVWESRGSKAVPQVEKTRPSVILLDWMLPELSGVEICKLIRNKPDIKIFRLSCLPPKARRRTRLKACPRVRTIMLPSLFPFPN